MLLSVITIAYNNLAGLKKTLSLFKEQKNPEIEIIVIDGGSKDGSKDFLQKQSITDCWVSEPDGGIYNAMNKGLSKASGEYVWFLNSGDYAYSLKSLETILQNILMKPDAIYGETVFVDNKGKELGTRSYLSTRKLPDNLNWKSFSLGMNVSHQSFIVKRSLALNYDEKYKYVADIDWMIRVLKSCKNVIRLDLPLSCFTNDGFSSKNRKSSNQERYRILQKHYGFVPNIMNHVLILIRKTLNFSKV